MISVEIHENSVFTHSKKDLFVGIWTHRDGVFEGPVSYSGKIQFPNKESAKLFHEQLEMMLGIGEWTEEI